MDRRAWKATVHGVTKSRTRLSNFTATITSIKSGIEHWVQWKLYKAKTGHIMANTSDGEIIDWSPKGDPLDKNNNLDLSILLNNTYDSMNNIVNSSI